MLDTRDVADRFVCAAFGLHLEHRDGPVGAALRQVLDHPSESSALNLVAALADADPSAGARHGAEIRAFGQLVERLAGADLFTVDPVLVAQIQWLRGVVGEGAR
jgi:hypothetical protein